MITLEINQMIMELVSSYGVEESIRGMYIAHGNEQGHMRQNQLSKQKLDEVQTFLDKITAKNDLSDTWLHRRQKSG